MYKEVTITREDFDYAKENINKDKWCETCVVANVLTKELGYAVDCGYTNYNEVNGYTFGRLLGAEPIIKAFDVWAKPDNSDPLTLELPATFKYEVVETEE